MAPLTRHGFGAPHVGQVGGGGVAGGFGVTVTDTPGAVTVICETPG